jgi:hypothetical protein
LPTHHELNAEATSRWLDEFGVFSFLFDPPAATAETFEPAPRDWFQEAGILVSRGAPAAGSPPVGVALKGGHNAEHHNHNDVGSYVLCVGDTMPLTDPGAEQYTRRTFSRQRYVSDVLNSYGHPVPLVAGQKQRTGRRAEGKVLKLNTTDEADTLQLDLTSAYGVAALERLHRTFVFRRQPASLTVTDEVQFDQPQSFGTALITYQPVRVISDRQLRIGTGQQTILVEIDAGDQPLTITETVIDEDVRGGRQPTRIGVDLQLPVARATIQLTASLQGGG